MNTFLTMLHVVSVGKSTVCTLQILMEGALWTYFSGVTPVIHRPWAENLAPEKPNTFTTHKYRSQRKTWELFNMFLSSAVITGIYMRQNSQTGMH